MIVYEIEYSPEAIRDLDDVFEDVLTSSKDIEITHKYIEELQDKVDSMVKRPKTGTPLYYEDLFTGYYSVRFKEYMAFYRLDETKILVDRILFRKRDYMRVLFGIEKG